MFNTSLSTSLWMGELDSSMDEPFLSNVFEQLGEVVVSIKILDSGKTYGAQGNSCFIEFTDVDAAQRVHQRINGKHIPGKSGKKFKLNPASYDRDRTLLPEFSLYVGDLSGNVDDFTMYSFFETKYKSVRSAKVIFDSSGKSKGYGFVRFSEEGDQLKALIEMQHMTGLGKRPIKVSLAKRPDPSAFNEQAQSFSPSYHGSHYSWGGYSYPYHDSSYHVPSSDYAVSSHNDRSENLSQPPVVDEDAEVLEDPELDINIGKENREYIESSESFFSALETSRWQPLDNVLSEISA